MKTVVWDVDDVLNDLMRVWFDAVWRPKHPKSELGYAEISENPPDRVLGISRADYLASLDEFRHSPAYARMEPIAQTLAWFEAHGHKCRHVALTAVPLHAAHVSAGWVMRHYGRWVRSFVVIPSPRETDPPHAYDTTKGDYLKRTGIADLFIDDTEANVDDAMALGVSSLLFPRPWNRDRQKPFGELFSTLARTLDSSLEDQP